MPKSRPWIKEQTLTTGTGNITLNGAISRFAAFAAGFGAEQVWYSIEDANGNREEGLGDFNGSTTLIRSTVTATIVSGTLNVSSPSPINLSGSAIVSCTFNSSTYEELASKAYEKQIIVKEPSDLDGTLDSSAVYFIDGIIDFTGSGINIEVPAGGLSLRGHNFDVSKLVCSDPNYNLFVSAGGGSGNIIGADYAVEITSQTNSKVYSLTPVDGFRAIELSRVNYNNCWDLGTITGYRQGFESGTGRFGGTPTLELAGVWGGGYFITSSIVRSLDAGMTGPLFKAGAGFSMASRFRSNMNLDLPASASYLDFAPSNFPNPSTLQLVEGEVSRNGVKDATDPNLTPNITSADLQSAWHDNNGLPNTYVGGKTTISTQATTTIGASDTFYDVAGTSTESNMEHFDAPGNFQLRHLGVNPRNYTAFINVTLQGTNGDNVTLKLVRWDDSASTFVDEGEILRPINNLVGGASDVAFFTGYFPIILDHNDYVKLQVSVAAPNSNDVTVWDDSFMFVQER